MKVRRYPQNIACRYFAQRPNSFNDEVVEQTLWSGVMAIDAAIPIGRGQRELIIGDRNVGKTALASDIVSAQRAGGVECAYVMIGQPMPRVRSLRDTLERVGCLNNTAIIAAYTSDSPGLQYLSPFAGASLAESLVATLWSPKTISRSTWTLIGNWHYSSIVPLDARRIQATFLLARRDARKGCCTQQ